LDIAAFVALITVMSAVSGIVLGWTGRTKTIRTDVAMEESKDALLRADMNISSAALTMFDLFNANKGGALKHWRNE
jgi:hypothetical protein